MAVYVETGGLKYSIRGKYHDNVKLFSLEFVSSYDYGRFPGEERRELVKTLTTDQLETLIRGLLNILESVPDLDSQLP